MDLAQREESAQAQGGDSVAEPSRPRLACCMLSPMGMYSSTFRTKAVPAERIGKVWLAGQVAWPSLYPATENAALRAKFLPVRNRIAERRQIAALPKSIWLCCNSFSARFRTSRPRQNI